MAVTIHTTLYYTTIHYAYYNNYTQLHTDAGILMLTEPTVYWLLLILSRNNLVESVSCLSLLIFFKKPGFFHTRWLKAILSIQRIVIFNKSTTKFPMVYTLIDHRNDVIKCSKLKWNHEPQASGFTAKFWTFYGIISMVYKSVDHGK